MNGSKKAPPPQKVHFWDPNMVFHGFAISGLCRRSAGSQQACCGVKREPRGVLFYRRGIGVRIKGVTGRDAIVAQ